MQLCDSHIFSSSPTQQVQSVIFFILYFNRYASLSISSSDKDVPLPLVFRLVTLLLEHTRSEGLPVVYPAPSRGLFSILAYPTLATFLGTLSPPQLGSLGISVLGKLNEVFAEVVKEPHKECQDLVERILHSTCCGEKVDARERARGREARSFDHFFENWRLSEVETVDGPEVFPGFPREKRVKINLQGGMVAIVDLTPKIVLRYLALEHGLDLQKVNLDSMGEYSDVQSDKFEDMSLSHNSFSREEFESLRLEQFRLWATRTS